MCKRRQQICEAADIQCLRRAESVRSQPNADTQTQEPCQRQWFGAEEGCANLPLNFVMVWPTSAETFSAFQVNTHKTLCCESGDLCLVATPDL